jgi:hypothetical protein
MSEPLHKYDTSELRDPLVRCHNCSKLVHQAFIRDNAGCNHCGNKRFQFIYGMDDKLEIEPLRRGEYDLGLKSYTIDEEYLDIFRAVGE